MAIKHRGWLENTCHILKQIEHVEQANTGTHGHISDTVYKYYTCI